MKNVKKYESCEIEAFLNWEEDEYDVDGIMTEVTFVDPVTGDRYWDPEFVDNEEKLFEVCMRYHKDDDEEKGEEVPVREKEDITKKAEECGWHKNKSEQLFVAFTDKDIEGTVDFGIDDIVDGWGHAVKLAAIIETATEDDPGNWEAIFARDKAATLAQDYLDLIAGRSRVIDKMSMFNRWAGVLGVREPALYRMTEEDPGGEGVLACAEGHVGGFDMFVTYRQYNKKN